jgi:hypothetical protein
LTTQDENGEQKRLVGIHVPSRADSERLQQAMIAGNQNPLAIPGGGAAALIPMNTSPTSAGGGEEAPTTLKTASPISAAASPISSTSPPPGGAGSLVEKSRFWNPPTFHNRSSQFTPNTTVLAPPKVHSPAKKAAKAASFFVGNGEADEDSDAGEFDSAASSKKPSQKQATSSSVRSSLPTKEKACFTGSTADEKGERLSSGTTSKRKRPPAKPPLSSTIGKARQQPGKATSTRPTKSGRFRFQPTILSDTDSESEDDVPMASAKDTRAGKSGGGPAAAVVAAVGAASIPTFVGILKGMRPHWDGEDSDEDEASADLMDSAPATPSLLRTLSVEAHSNRSWLLKQVSGPTHDSKHPETFPLDCSKGQVMLGRVDIEHSLKFTAGSTKPTVTRVPLNVWDINKLLVIGRHRPAEPLPDKKKVVKIGLEHAGITDNHLTIKYGFYKGSSTISTNGKVLIGARKEEVRRGTTDTLLQEDTTISLVGSSGMANCPSDVLATFAWTTTSRSHVKTAEDTDDQQLLRFRDQSREFSRVHAKLQCVPISYIC